jgi:hypothetical protein
VEDWPAIQRLQSFPLWARILSDESHLTMNKPYHIDNIRCLASRAKSPIEEAVSSDAFKIFIGLFILYMLTMKTVPVSDCQGNSWLPVLLLKHGSLDFSNIGVAPGNYLFYPHNGGLYSVFGLGAPLLALPFYLPVLFQGSVSDFQVMMIAKVAAAFMSALAAVFIYLAAKKLSSRRNAVIAALIFGLATSMFSMSSQMLLTFTGSVLCSSVGLYCLLSGNERRGYVVAAGVAFAWAGLCHPVMLVMLLVLGIYVLRRRTRDLFWYAAGAAPVVALMAAYQWVSYGLPWRTGEFPESIYLITGSWNADVSFWRLWNTPIHEGLGGTLVSTSRGLFVFSPILIFAFLGLYLHIRKKGDPVLVYGFVGSAVVVLITSKWFDWAGGNSWGYRILLSILPFLILLIVPALDTIFSKKALEALFVVLLLFSVFVQVVGYISYDGGSWEWTDLQGVQGREKFWSLSSSQLGWELANFHFYIPYFFREVISEPIKAEFEDITVEEDRVIACLSVSQIATVHAWLTSEASPLEPVARFTKTVPRGENVIVFEGVNTTEPLKLNLAVFDETNRQQSIRSRVQVP